MRVSIRYQNVATEKENLLVNHMKMQEFVEEFQNANISCPKSKDKIFERKDIRQQITGIARRSRVKDVQFKEDAAKGVEIKFQAANEKEAYDFLEKLYFELSSIVQFNSIKIGRFSDNKIHVACVIKTELPPILKNDIEMYPAQYLRPQFNLFDTRKKHQLNCVILGHKVFVDNGWYSLDDTIDEYKISKINQNTVELKSAKKTIVIQLGHSW